MPADVIDTFFYHQALAELRRSARAFAYAMTDAAEIAIRIDGDDLVAIRTFEECRRALLQAFAQAPGMLQLFMGKAT